LWTFSLNATQHLTHLPDLPFQNDLKPILLLGSLDAKLWPMINIVMITWALLIFAPRWKWTPTLTLIPIVYFAIFYAASVVLLLYFPASDDWEKAPEIDMTTFEGVVALFQDSNGVALGWIHYCGFDPLVGRMIIFDLVERGASSLFHIVAMVPCVALTLFLGPTGWLLYMILRQVFLLVVIQQEGSSYKVKSF
jgi:hypothetical protein